MKSKLLIVSVFVSALIIGLLVGAGGASWCWNRYVMRNFVYLPTSNQIYDSVRTLTALRHGQQADALETQEILLDGALITFVGYEKVLSDQQNVSCLKAIRMAREYRTAHPFSGSSAIVSNAVQQVFLIVK